MINKVRYIFIIGTLTVLLTGCSSVKKIPPPVADIPPVETPVEEPEPVPEPIVEPLPEIQPEIKPENPAPVPEPPPPEPEELIHEPWTQTLWSTAPLNLRTEPHIEGEIILRMSLGESVETLSKISNGWYKVMYDGIEGYASGKYLTEKEDEPVNTGYAPYRIHIGEKIIIYENGGMDEAQLIIDTNRSMASTWGDVTKWSPDDRKNTYFVGHSDAAFEGIWNTPMDTEIIITDEFGNPTTYVLKEIYVVDDYAVGIEDGISYYEYLVGAGEKEVITLQTCQTEDTNYILRAIIKE